MIKFNVNEISKQNEMIIKQNKEIIKLLKSNDLTETFDFLKSSLIEINALKPDILNLLISLKREKDDIKEKNDKWEKGNSFRT